ncbi:MAG TPA: hypothetical protein PKB10_11400, partial [Tepidisphaeraceae bacterium]|nr:hypothetical protein [Tepidisphaeraceae bacterium]
LGIVPLLYYTMNPESWHFVNNRSATRFFRENRLIDDAPRLIFSDVISTVDADAWSTRHWDRRVHSPIGDPNAMHAVLRELPVGTVGIWDNQRGQVWHHASIEQLEALGFEVLHESRFRAPFQETLHKFIPRLRKRPIEQRMVVVRKTEMRSPTTLPVIPRPDLDE